MVRISLTSLAILLGSSAFAGNLVAQSSANNGMNASGSGIFLDLTNLSSANLLTVTGLNTYALSATGTTWTIDVYTRTGSYVGNTASSDGWTKLTTAISVSTGQTPSSPKGTLTLPTGIAVGAGSTVGVYLAAVTGGLRYYGTGLNDDPPASQTTFANADLRLYSATSSSELFGGNQYKPRTFAGSLDYTVSPVPEPMTFAVLALGMLPVLRRRKS